MTVLARLFALDPLDLVDPLDALDTLDWEGARSRREHAERRAAVSDLPQESGGTDRCVRREPGKNSAMAWPLDLQSCHGLLILVLIFRGPENHVFRYVCTAYLVVITT